jgi:parallel beta-helix repeat protein
MKSNVKSNTPRTGIPAKTVLGTILLVLGLIAFASPASLFERLPSAFASEGNVLKVPRDFATIQAAVNAASSGDTIKVAAGVYNENVVIATSGIRLRASSGAVIDGAGLTGTGILVLAAAAQPVTGVEISGFEVRDFQRGIVVQLATETRILGNEVHDNIKWPGAAGALDQAVGIDLNTAHSSNVSENFVHNNGARGISLRVGSTNNVVQGNRIFENGMLLKTTMGGAGVLTTGAGTNDNEISENEILRNYGDGVMVTRPAGTVPITGNLVAKNQAHENQRAGISCMGATKDNVIFKNDARDNNLSGLPPCLTFNLFEEIPGSNIWTRNKGTSNY